MSLFQKRKQVQGKAYIYFMFFLYLTCLSRPLLLCCAGQHKIWHIKKKLIAFSTNLPLLIMLSYFFKADEKNQETCKAVTPLPWHWPPPPFSWTLFCVNLEQSPLDRWQVWVIPIKSCSCCYSFSPSASLSILSFVPALPGSTLNG